MFYEDLNNNALPQWMFITPNMTNDGHDSSVTVAGTWAKNFLEPLLTNENFMNNTLVFLSSSSNYYYYYYYFGICQ
jgi:acid phosphatase